MEQELLDFINKCVREEKGTKVSLYSKLADTDLDSLGMFTLFVELDSNYNFFGSTPDNVDPFESIDYDTITIKEIVDICSK